MQPNNKRFQEAVRYSFKLLSIRRRTIYEMTSKLQKKQFKKSLIRAVIDYLVKEKYLDDALFVQEFVDSYRKRKYFGVHRLRYELKRRGVNNNDIDSGLEKISFDNEIACAQRAARQKVCSLLKGGVEKHFMSTTKHKKQIYDFLRRRGFAFEIIRSVVHDIKL